MRSRKSAPDRAEVEGVVTHKRRSKTVAKRHVNKRTEPQILTPTRQPSVEAPTREQPKGTPIISRPYRTVNSGTPTGGQRMGCVMDTDNRFNDAVESQPTASHASSAENQIQDEAKGTPIEKQMATGLKRKKIMNLWIFTLSMNK